MRKITIPPFVKMCWWGISGSLAGIIGGMILGIFIFGLQTYIQSWTFTEIRPANTYMYALYYGWQQPTMFGASFGAIIGAIFGSIFGLKDISKK